MPVHPDDVDEKEMQPGTHITIAMDGTDRLSSPSPLMEQSPTVPLEEWYQPSDVCVPQSPTVPQNRIEQPIRERPYPIFVVDVPWGILPSAFPSASVVEIPALVSDDGEIPELVSDDGETLGGF
jgi:hypothetical protein